MNRAEVIELFESRRQARALNMRQTAWSGIPH